MSKTENRKSWRRVPRVGFRPRGEPARGDYKIPLHDKPFVGQPLSVMIALIV